MTSQSVEQIDPRTLLIDLNLPGRDKAGKDLAASIAALGVLEPIIGYRTASHEIRVRFGHRRTLAAIDAGLDTVPVLVVADEDSGTAADIDRVIGQYHENTYREDLTPAQESHVVAQLLDLGLTAGAIHKKTRMPKDKIQAARTVRDSAAASQAVASYGMTLDQAAALAAFEDDSQATQLLLDAARKDAGSFWHQEQRLRDDRDSQQAIAAKRAELEESGITVTDVWPGWEHGVGEWAEPDGTRLTNTAHQLCPGHAAFIRSVEYGPEPVRVDYFCADPKG